MGCIFGKQGDAEQESFSPVNNLPVIIFHGVPGVDVLPIAKNYAREAGYVLINPEQLLNMEGEKSTIRGRTVSSYLKKKQNPPPELLLELIIEEINSETKPSTKGFIFVGYPKSVKMTCFFNKHIKSPDSIIILDADQEYIMKNLPNSKSSKESKKTDSKIKAAKTKIDFAKKQYKGNFFRINAAQSNTKIQEEIAENLKQALAPSPRDSMEQVDSTGDKSESVV